MARGTTDATARGRWWRSAWCRALLALSLLAAAFGCTDDLDQRADQPGAAVITMTSAERAAAGPTPRSGQSAASSTDGRGNLPALPEQRRIYFVRRGDIWQLPIDNAAAPVVTNRDVLAYAPSPSGEQVAVVLQAGNREQFQLVNADSTVAFEATLPQPTPNAPNAATGTRSSVRSIAWAPQSLTVAVARQDGSILTVSAAGEVKTVVPERPGSAPGGLAWSSDGQLLAYLDPALPGQPTGLYVVDAARGAPRLIVESTTTTQAVQTVSWIPTSRSLVFIQAAPSAASPGGDIFEFDVDTNKRRLLQPAGQFAPLAGALNLAVSGGGDALAFTIFAPGDDGPHFQGLWIYDFESRRLTEIATSADEAVTDLWWASGQLIYRGVPESAISLTGTYTGTEPFALYQLAPLQQNPLPAERYRSP